MLALTGVASENSADNPHIIRSSDGMCAVWLGAIDDLWDLGKPVGQGGPWTATSVAAGEHSDPYLLAGFDQKQLTLEHDAEAAVNVTLEVDISGTGSWYALETLEVPAGQQVRYQFPDQFEAYWVRLATDRDCVATAEFLYQ
jgi:hypothetical protein